MALELLVQTNRLSYQSPCLCVCVGGGGCSQVQQRCMEKADEVDLVADHVAAVMPRACEGW